MKTILFVCVHNAGRSQMAEAFFNHFATERGFDSRAKSAGTAAAGVINPVAAQAMAEIGVPLDGQTPKLLTQELADEADKIITMGCGAEAAACPARFLVSEDWDLEDPAGKTIEQVRKIRDEIKRKVNQLITQMGFISEAPSQ